METKFTMGVPTLPLTGFKLSLPASSTSPLLLPGGVSGLDLLSGCAIPAFPPASASSSPSAAAVPPQQFVGSLPPLSSLMGPVSLLPPQHLAIPFQLTPEGQRDLLALLAPPPATPASVILQSAALTRKHIHPHHHHRQGNDHHHHHSEGTCTEEETDSNSHSDDEEDSEEGEEGDEVDSEEGEAARAGDSHLLEIPDSKDRGSSSTSSPVMVSHHHSTTVDSVKLPGRRGRRPKPPHERRHKCTMCNRDFKRMEHLKRHLRVHTGEKPFSCPFPGCPKYFSRQDNLTQHIKTHKNRAERGSLGHLSEDGGDDQ